MKGGNEDLVDLLKNEKKMIYSLLVIGFLMISIMPVVTAVNLTINSPLNDNIYNNRSVLFDLSSDVNANFYYIKDLSGRQNWFLLCSENQTCIKSVELRGGINNISFKAVDLDGNDGIKSIAFVIDTTRPVILDTSPKNGEFMSGGENKFIINYTEENLANITLFYGTYTDMRLESKNETYCLSGKNKGCIFNVNLTDFDRKKITYWFKAIDKANNVRESKNNTVKIDLTAPDLIIYNKVIDIVRKKVTFFFEIKEDNFKKIVYIDYNETRPVWKTLCSNLRIDRCTATKSFARGQHNLNISVSDDAGNVLIKNDTFIV